MTSNKKLGQNMWQSARILAKSSL